MQSCSIQRENSHFAHTMLKWSAANNEDAQIPNRQVNVLIPKNALLNWIAGNKARSFHVLMDSSKLKHWGHVVW